MDPRQSGEDESMKEEEVEMEEEEEEEKEQRNDGSSMINWNEMT